MVDGKTAHPARGQASSWTVWGHSNPSHSVLEDRGREDIHTTRRNDGQQVAAGMLLLPLATAGDCCFTLASVGCWHVLYAAPPPSHLRILRRWSSGLMLSDHAPRHPRGSAGQPCRVILSLFFLLCCPSPWLRSRTRSVFFSFSWRLEKNKNR